MKATHVQSRVASFVMAIVFLLQVSPAQAGGAPNAARDNHRRHIDITFTKWITNTRVPLVPPVLMAGYVGGDVVGDFAGEVLANQPSANLRITRLEAIYEVKAGVRSFTALIRGGQNNDQGTAILDGVILAGWRTGDRVHVEYRVVHACGQSGALFDTCFRGTIQINRDSDE